MHARMLQRLFAFSENPKQLDHPRVQRDLDNIYAQLRNSVDEGDRDLGVFLHSDEGVLESLVVHWGGLAFLLSDFVLVQRVLQVETELDHVSNEPIGMSDIFILEGQTRRESFRWQRGQSSIAQIRLEIAAFEIDLNIYWGVSFLLSQ